MLIKFILEISSPRIGDLMEKTMIIIGAGTAGLSAGCFAQMNGFHSIIYEMTDKPGGLCTSWKRKGYLFDGSVAGLAGSAPGTPLYRLWQEIGVIDYCPLHYGENFGRIIAPDGRRVTVYSDVDRFEKELLEVFPNEEKVVREFSDAIRSVLRVDPPFKSSQGFTGLAESLKSAGAFISSAPAVMKYSGMSIREFSEKTSDPLLQQVLTNIAHFGGTDVPLLTILLPLAYAHRKMAGIPVKGLLDFARAIEKRYLELGGKIIYRSKVERLFVENGKATGIFLEGGELARADIVLSAADGQFSHYNLMNLPESLGDSKFQPEKVSDQPMQVNLGVAEDMSDDDGPMTFLLGSPFSAGGKQHEKITVHNKYYDPEAAPKGKSAVTVFLDSTYNWWSEISKDPNRYTEEKKKTADAVIQAIESHHPGFTRKVEVVDVSTPLTRERYTGNWMGAMQAFKPDSNLMSALFGSPQYAHPSVENYYMAGQWVEAWGGITTAAQSARKAVARICKDTGRRFQTRIP
jgi:phytoene dehydrogenase-like protein